MKIQFIWNGKNPKHVLNLIGELNGLDAIVQCLVEFKQNKISLDFCLTHAFICIGVRESPKVDFFSAMEKKNEQNNSR
jgi:hypothetical protein